MIQIDVNANHHHVNTKTPMHDMSDPRQADYRRRWEENPKNFEYGEFPLHLDVESTSICNLKCPFCGTTHGGYKPGYMDFELYRRIIDEGAENGLCSVKFNMRGEPLMHEELARMVAYAKQKGIIDVFFNTNATLLDEVKAVALMDAGLDRIAFSFEGVEKEAYEKSRVGARFEYTVNNIKMFKKLRDARGEGRPKIRVQTVLLPNMANQLDRYAEFFDPLADEISYVDLRDEIKRPTHDACDWACPQLWQRMSIFWDGTLLPCCFDVYAREAHGNVRDVSIREAWKGERQNRLRELHMQGRAHEIPACKDCPLRSSEIAKLEGAKGI